MKVQKFKERKLGKRGFECIFVCYVENMKVYKFMVIEFNEFYPVNIMIELRDVMFNEKILFYFF